MNARRSRGFSGRTSPTPVSSPETSATAPSSILLMNLLIACFSARAVGTIHRRVRRSSAADIHRFPCNRRDSSSRPLVMGCISGRQVVGIALASHRDDLELVRGSGGDSSDDRRPAAAASPMTRGCSTWSRNSRSPPGFPCPRCISSPIRDECLRHRARSRAWRRRDHHRLAGQTSPGTNSPA